MSKKNEKYQQLITYWDTIDLIKVTEQDQTEIFSHKAREIILKTLSDGKKVQLDHYDGKTYNLHTLPAKELLEDVNAELPSKERIKVQTLYFHLQKLIESGFIQRVATIHEGRHNIAYFGKTARYYRFVNRKKEREKYRSYFAETQKLIKKLTNETEAAEIDSYYKHYVQQQQQIEQEIFEWVNSQADFFTNSDIELPKVVNLLMKLGSNHQELYEKMKAALKFENQTDG